MITYHKFILERDKLFEETFKIKPNQINNQKLSINFPQNNNYIDGIFSVITNGESFRKKVECCSDSGSIGCYYGEFILPFIHKIVQLNLYKNNLHIAYVIPIWRLEIAYKLCEGMIVLSPQVVLCNYNDDKDRNPNDCYEFVIPVEVTCI